MDAHSDEYRVRRYQPLTALGIPLRVRQGETRARNDGQITYWHLEGVLGPFIVDHYNYYWRVSGPMPLDVAREMYAHPEGRQSVRVAGHCGCPPPGEWATWRAADGREVLSLSARKEWEDNPTILRACGGWERVNRDYVFSDDPASIGARALVESYHIDTEAGLVLFVETVRRHRLDQPAERPC